MLKLFDLFKYGILALLTSPLWLGFFVYKLIESIIIFFIYLIKGIIDFFRGKPFFDTKEDKAIALLKAREQSELDQMREEALKDVENDDTY